MESRFRGQKAVQTPHLDLTYQAMDFRSMREMGETWRILTPGTPQPQGIDATARGLRASGDGRRR
jgi:predicted solute-binding protein